MSETAAAPETSDLAPTPRPRRAATMVALSVLILIFGAAIGSGVTLMLMQERMLRPFRGHRREPEAIASHLRRSLALSDEQTRHVTEVFRQRVQAMQQIRSTIESEHGKLQEGLKKVLTPEQYQRWQTEFQFVRRRALGDGRGQGRHGGPGGGQPVDEVFRRHDADGDGRLTRDEMPPHAAERMMRADADRDAVVTREELRKARGGRRQGPPGPRMR